MEGLGTIQRMWGCLTLTVQQDITPNRLAVFERELLARISDAGAKVVVVDLAGVAAMGPDEFTGLRRVLSMAQVMGMVPVLTGINPGVASALVDLGANTDGITVVRSLDAAYDWLVQRRLIVPARRRPAIEIHRYKIKTPADTASSTAGATAVAKGAGFDAVACQDIATSVAELVSNILKYAHRGDVLVRVLHDAGRRGIEVEARDDGPGIADPAQAVRDGVSTGGTLGLGLPGVKRMMDEFELETSPAGTVVRARKWRGDKARS